MEDAGDKKPGQGGRWPWEDGTQVPTPRSDRRMPGQSLPTPVLMALVAAMVVVFFLLWALITTDGGGGSDVDDAELRRQGHELYCERYAEPGDPDCW